MSISVKDFIQILPLTEDSEIDNLKIFEKLVNITDFTKANDLITVIKKIRPDCYTDENVDPTIHALKLFLNTYKLHVFDFSQEDYFKLLIKKNILSKSSDMGIFYDYLTNFPSMIFNVLNLIMQSIKRDPEKLQLIKAVVNGYTVNYTVNKEFKPEPTNDLAELLSTYFDTYSHYVKSCKLFNIDESIYSAYENKIKEEADTITFSSTKSYELFDIDKSIDLMYSIYKNKEESDMTTTTNNSINKLRFSEMMENKCYIFERQKNNYTYIFKLQKYKSNYLSCTKYVYIKEQKEQFSNAYTKIQKINNGIIFVDNWNYGEFIPSK